jgi:hypothetical protein
VDLVVFEGEARIECVFGVPLASGVDDEDRVLAEQGAAAAVPSPASLEWHMQDAGITRGGSCEKVEVKLI